MALARATPADRGVQDGQHRMLIVAIAHDAGYWAKVTFDPVTKCTPERAVDRIERYPAAQIVARLVKHNTGVFHRTVYDNPSRVSWQGRKYDFEAPLRVT